MKETLYDNELGVDISEGADLTDETLLSWCAAGVRRVYVQYSSKLSEYLTQLESFNYRWQQHLVTDVYVYEYFPFSPWFQTPEMRVRAALAACRGHAVRRVWLDVEDPNDSAPPDVVVAALWRCIALVEAAGYKAGIYTGYYTWKAHTGDSVAFAAYPLWHADYLGEAPVPDMSRRPETLYFRTGPYFGKTAPDVWQWWNTTTLGGHSVDLDVEKPKEDDMKFALPRPGIADWWTDRLLEPDGESTWMNAAVDLGALPGDIARFQVDLDRGDIRFFHGSTNLVAGDCRPGITVVEATVNDAGEIEFSVETSTLVNRLFCLGYWRS